MTKTQRNGIIGGSVLLAMLVAGIVAWRPASNYIDMLQAMRAFGKANDAYGKREYETAIEYYAQATENSPEDDALIQTTLRFFSASSNHLLYRPMALDDPMMEDYLDNALDGYEETIEIVEGALQDPGLSEEQRDSLTLYERYASEQLAGIYRDYLDDLEMSEHYFNRLIEMEPEDPARYYALADVYERFHDPEENPLLEKAVEAYQVPVELNPEDPIGYRQVANLLNKYGRFDETMEWLARARDVAVDNPEGYYLIATYYWDKVYRDPDLSQRERVEFIELGLEQLDQAIEINDEYIDALIYKNLLLREKAKVEPRNSAALIAEADEYRTRAIELRNAIQAAQEAAAAEAAEAGTPQ